MSSSTPSILKPGPMTWLISSARPALESVSQPVPGDQSEVSSEYRCMAVEYVGDHVDEVPKVVAALQGKRAVQIAAGDGHHNLVLMEDGEVFSFGFGAGGRLGHGDTVVAP